MPVSGFRSFVFSRSLWARTGEPWRNGEDWTWEEVLVALKLCDSLPLFKKNHDPQIVYPKGRPLHIDEIKRLEERLCCVPVIVRVAERLGRTPRAIAVKVCYLANRRAGGNVPPTKIDEEVWERLNASPDETLRESGRRLAELLGEPETIAMPEGRESDEEAAATGPPVAYERSARPEQRRFRERLVRAYGGRCAVTGEAADVVLQASHLPGRDHARHNRASDGVLLRADLHLLLDAGLMTFTADGVVQIAADAGPEYRKLRGRSIRFPQRAADRPKLK